VHAVPERRRRCDRPLRFLGGEAGGLTPVSTDFHGPAGARSAPAGPSRSEGSRRRIAVAGATGFVGRALLPALARRHDVIALRRGDAGARDAEPGVEWRRCDLFSLRDTEAALEGADAAVYLVHSMLPSARLTQGRFEDLDLLLADGFGRAAARSGVRRIVYLGGLVPRDERALSAHLASRLEVERALAAHGVPVTAVRAALVVGRGGSSLDILLRLVERLPLMLCPAWTLTPSAPIDLDDVVAALVHCLDDPATTGRVCEIGGPDVLSYRDMMLAAARALGRRRLLLPVPFLSPRLSRLWVTLVSGAPRTLVAPLVESLRHPMVPSERWLQERMARPGRRFAESLAAAIAPRAAPAPSTVRSVQRLPLPAGRDAAWVAREYVAWLPRFVRPLVQVRADGPRALLRLRGLAPPLLVLEAQAERSSADRALFEIRGGLLAGPPGGAAGGLPRLEFRTTPDGAHVLAAVQDFRPRLPWWLYRVTQAQLHALVMWAFGRHLARLAALGAPPP
jgi:uncharacterized protein YbjT (DUF2867 family)